MQQQFSNFQEFLKSIKILHLALLGGLTLIIVLFKFVLGVEDRSNGDYLFTIIGLTMAMSSLGIGYLIFNKKIEGIRDKDLPELEKLKTFREAFILKVAMLEGAALVCMNLFFIEGSPLLFYTALFLWSILAFEHPNAQKIKETLRIG